MPKRLLATPSPIAGPVLLVLVSALFWGLWWVPVRLCEALGLVGVWANLGINFGALLILALPAAFGRPIAGISRRALLGAALIGMAVALYGAALSLTDVARAVLLFYLAPAWSTVIEVAFLGQRWHWRRLPPLVLSMAGMIAILRGEISVDQGSIGDLAALISGMAWSAGAALVFSSDDRAPEQAGGKALRLSLIVMLAAVITSILLLPLDWHGWPRPGSGDVTLAVFLALGAGVFYLAPIIGVTLWGAGRLMPTTISFLLAAEILSGITSSALFLDEPFGLWEVTGTVMIIASVMAHIAFGDDHAPTTS